MHVDGSAARAMMKISHENRRKKKTVENVISISGRRDELVVVFCVKSIASSLSHFVYVRFEREKFIFRPVCVRSVVFLPFFYNDNEEEEEDKLHRRYLSPRIRVNDINHRKIQTPPFIIFIFFVVSFTTRFDSTVSSGIILLCFLFYFRKNSSQVHSHFGFVEVGRNREREKYVYRASPKSQETPVCIFHRFLLLMRNDDGLREERHDKNVAIFTFSQQMP